MQTATKLIEGDGGKVVEEVSPALDYLVLGQVKGKPTPAQKQVEQLEQEQGVKIPILSLADFHQLFAPDRALAEAILRAGSVAQNRWLLLRCGGGMSCVVDLNGIDLRNVKLTNFGLWNVNFDGADLRDAEWQSVNGLSLSNSRLDGIRLTGASVCKLTYCSARRAEMTKLYFNASCPIERTDLTEANLSGCSLGSVQTTQVNFSLANLSRAYLNGSKHLEANFTGANLSEAELGLASLAGARLCQANLQKANLIKANLSGADLTGADLRWAALTDADLTGATVAGANFEGANLVGAKIKGLDLSQALGLPAAPTTAPASAGPKLQELGQLAGQVLRLTTSTTVDLPDGAAINLSVESTRQGKVIYCRSSARGSPSANQPAAVSVGMLGLVRPFLHGTLRLDSIKITAAGASLTPKPLRELAVAAWCEACGIPVPSGKDLKEKQQQEKDALVQRREQAVADLRAGQKGVERWNALNQHERTMFHPYLALDLSGAKLTGVDLNHLSFRGSRFDGAELRKADLQSGDFTETSFRKADFTEADLRCGKFNSANLEGAKLHKCNLRVCQLRKANFQGADLTGAYLAHANLCGADLSTAVLDDVELQDATYDDQTKWPTGFKVPPGLRWKGAGSMPGPAAPAVPPPAPVENLDVVAFMKRLERKVEGGRLTNALQMLKAERFQLFSQVEEQALAGVIRSQSSPERVYSGVRLAFSA